MGAIVLVLAAALSWPVLPNPALTPGAAVRGVTAREVCVPGYATKARRVTAAAKREVYRRYGIDKTAGVFEVDHLIPLTLGGANSADNLWPQSFETQPWNAAVKDKLEVRLNRLVCAGQLALRTAQQAIARDWRQALVRYVGEPAAFGVVSPADFQ